MMMILMMMVIANDYVDEDICRRKAEFPGLPSLAFHPLSGDIYTGLTQRQKYFYRSDPMAVCQILTKLKVGRLTLIFSHPNLSFSVCSPLGRQGGRTRQICFSLTHQKYSAQPTKVFGPPNKSISLQNCLSCTGDHLQNTCYLIPSVWKICCLFSIPTKNLYWIPVTSIIWRLDCNKTINQSKVCDL